MSPPAGNPVLTPDRGTRRAPSACSGLIALAVLAAYANSFSGAFVLDDTGTILSNPSLRRLGTALFPPSNGTPVSGRPIANLSFALNYALGGTNVWGYHAVNVLIHVLAALTLFGIARRTLAARGHPRALELGFSAALLWAVHPLQTAAVTYVSQRVEALMGLFYLLTLYCFIRGAQGSTGILPVRPLPHGRDARAPLAWSVLSWLACLLGMATKEVMVTAPLVVLLYDRTFGGGGFREALRRRPRYYAALASSWILLAALVAASGSRAGTAGFSSSVPWWAYALTQVRAVAHYLRLSAWPHPLVGDYGRILGGPPIELGGDAALLAGLLAASAVLSWRRSPWGFVGLSFFLILAPSSSVVPVATEIIAEHRMYLPLALVVVGVVLAADRALAAAGWVPAPGTPRRSVRSHLGALLLILTAGSCMAATSVRNRAYRSVLAFWSDVAAKAPESAGAHNNLGNALAERGDAAGAAAQFERALSLAPDYADAHGNLANLLLAEDRNAQAFDHYRAALRFRPEEPAWRAGAAVAACRLANACAERGRDAEAAELYRAALQARPEYPDASVNYGLVLARLGRLSDAIAQLQAALRVEPLAADVHNDLGGLLAEAGRFAEARAQFEEALRLNPDYAEARDNLERVERMQSAGAR